MKRDSASTTDGLIFPWGDKPASYWRLLPYLALCIVVLAGFFILFKISYPISEPLPRTSQGILMLNPDLPAHQLVLNRAYDKSTLVLKPESELVPPHDTPMLPLFRPSFQGYAMKLKDTAQQESALTLHRLFLPEDLALPSKSSFGQSIRFPPKPRESRSVTLQVRFGGPLADRELDTPFHLTGVTPQDLPRLRFHLTVNSLGRVSLALPLSASAEDRLLVPAIQAALSQMRFVPRPGSANQNDLATFGWTSQPPRD